MTLPTILKQEAEALFPQLVAWRRDFHTHPELGFEEVRTAGIVADHLRELGLEVSTGVGRTGVVAMIEGDDLPDDAPTVLLRFDMDALPIQEVTDSVYKSQNPGKMHACGHDGHTAMGMGVAKVLSQHRAQLGGRVKLVFQPGEEGLGGAMAMIRDGVLENPKPAVSFSLHLWSQLPLNQVVVQEGPVAAGADKIVLTVHGKAGHGAIPSETVDAIVVASHVLVAWQSIIARNVHPLDSAVMTIGIFQAGTASNIIAGEAKLTGSIRWFRKEVRDLLLRRLAETANGVCAGFGATCTFEIGGGVTALINSPVPTAAMRRAANAVVNPEQMIQMDPLMVSEDMSEMLNRVPGCYILIGASDPGRPMHAAHHNEKFDFDERMMPTGVAVMANAAVEYLRGEK